MLLGNKGPSSQRYGFSNNMYVCEIAECRIIDAFEWWCWTRLLRVPWTARRSNQSILREISTEYSLEELMLKLKLQYFGHLMWRTDSLEKTLMLEGIGAGEEGDNRGWDGWMASPTGWTWVWVNSRSWWWTGRPGVLQFCGQEDPNTTEWLNWTDYCITGSTNSIIPDVDISIWSVYLCSFLRSTGDKYKECIFSETF